MATGSCGTVAVTRLFLGMELQCARCHDHPTEAWTQVDFYGMAAFFARLKVTDAGGKEVVHSFRLVVRCNDGKGSTAKGK